MRPCSKRYAVRWEDRDGSRGEERFRTKWGARDAWARHFLNPDRAPHIIDTRTGQRVRAF